MQTPYVQVATEEAMSTPVSAPDVARLPLSAEELLTTTRSVRKRLDFSRPVSRELLRACVALALQAPSGSNRWTANFVIVTEEERRMALGEAHCSAYAAYQDSRGYIGKVDKGDTALNAQQQRDGRLGRAPRGELPPGAGDRAGLHPRPGRR